ncbi:hypothetical protein [Mariniflexile sp. AS56]|uniref:hypothetical protein n=1 Tax=Mariniflexile sp. AS56 TaxID=3063957 RepID=UPI0026EB5218|nr:hypothetical protein [Mariniflexile sp. AS56]MDO7173755.1 hypothetical protein [Mariniflexile sp. AS56]
MNRIIPTLLLLIVSLFLSSCKEGQANSKPQTLDINMYLAAASSNDVSPTSEQLDMLRVVVPEEHFQLAPSISDRDYWEGIAATDSGKLYVADARSDLNFAPEVPITDSIYRLANKEGNRDIYKPRYYRTMTRLEHFMLAECIENKGLFLPQIEVYLEAILSMKSWLHPNHDNESNDVLEGNSMAIDLGSRRFGSDLALAEVLLQDKLSADIRENIKVALQKRIIDAYLQSTSGETQTHLNWYTGTSNWNSVCTSGAVFVTISTSQNYNERLQAVGTAINSMKSYISGFGDDGYCSEGAGYWGYGFGHYLYLSEIIYDFTNGAINLFAFDDPEKLENVANFPYRYQIAEGVFSPFADGVTKISYDGGFAKRMVARKYGAGFPWVNKNLKTSDTYPSFYQLIEWNYMIAEKDGGESVQVVNKLPDHTYFDQFGMVLSRGNQDIPLSIAIKAGHNSENHNHMDVGTYTIVMGKDIMAGDIGAPSYTAGAFSDDNPARSSWGHPVPRINNMLQSKGRRFEGKITATAFSESRDKVVMDMKAAYEIPILNNLERIMENDKSGNGSISITDAFSLSEPGHFGIAIMTLSDYEIVDAHTVILKTANHTLKTEVSSEDGFLKITDERVPVERLREGGPAYRIGVDFTQPISQGSITLRFTPVF